MDRPVKAVRLSSVPTTVSALGPHDSTHGYPSKHHTSKYVPASFFL